MRSGIHRTQLLKKETSTSSPFRFKNPAEKWDPHAGYIYKTLSVPHMQEIAVALKEAAQTAQTENRLCEIAVEGAIAFAFAPEDRRAELEAWAKPRRTEVDGVSGPPLDADLVTRVKGKISNEQKQLPTDTPNLVVITAYQNFIFPVELRRIVREIEEAVYEHPHIAFASLHTHWGDRADTGTIRIGNHVVNVRRGWINFACTVIFSNRFSKFTISDETAALLQKALMEL